MAVQRPQRGDYRHFQPLTTRWHDNDVYGHVNNVVYYGYFDSAVNAWLIEQGLLDIHNDRVVGYVASSSCDYFAAVAFPQRLEVGMAVERLGNSSVRYVLGVFVEGEQEARAAGRFVHVYVNRERGCAVPVPAGVRRRLEPLLLG
ncbi:acyl-CoA thioesterase [Pseudomonas sp. NPDC089401]|uniref:acyl-CoA thioesterase n=1 Tax=Pseudomonas sp. NPDC089401 TaxID=3364462 RepID=UPI0038119BE8